MNPPAANPLATPQTDYWVRTNLAVEVHLKDALIDVLHNTQNDPAYIGLPMGEPQLYQCMVQFKLTHQGKLKNVLRPNQWNDLCPANGKSNSKDWDITLLVVVIINATNLPPPQGGWNQKQPKPGDTSRAAHVLLARWLRNETKHGSISDIQTLVQFNTRWRELKQGLLGLQYDINKMKEFDDLESGTMKLYTSATVKLLEDKHRDLQQELDDLKCQETADVGQLQTDLQNFNILVVTLEATKVSNDEYSGLTSSLLDANKIFETEIEELKAKQNELSNVVQKLDEKLSDTVAVDTSWEKGVVLDVVLEIVAQMITKEDWKVLSDLNDFSLLEKYFASNQRKLELLKKQSYDWKTLKTQLRQIKRCDIIDHIKQNSNVTIEFDQIVTAHRRKMLNKFSERRQTKPFLNPIGQTEVMERSEMETFVDLAILDGNTTSNDNDDEERLLGSSREHEHNKIYISIDSIVQEADTRVFIRGIPGIGKSFLIKKIITEWARGNILNGKSGMPYVRLLLPIFCRELNTLKIQGDESSEQILQLIFPNIFPEQSLIKKMSQNLLFLIDGIDELQSVESIAEDQRPPLVNFLWELANPSDEASKYRCIFAGRPTIICKFQSALEEHFGQKLKKILVCGFSKGSVSKYIQQEFRDQTLATNILQKLDVSPILSAMSRIPIYMWVLTGVFHYNPLSATPKTTTELLLYTYLLFIRSHQEKQGILKSELTLMTLCKSSIVIKSLLAISSWSFATLMNSEIVFESDEDLCYLEEIGLITSFNYGETGKRFYQFQHLVLQEFLAALHIFIKRSRKEDIFVIQECFHLVAGLEGIHIGNVCGSESMLKVLLENMVKFSELPESSVVEQKKQVAVKGWLSSFFTQTKLTKTFKKHVINLSDELPNYHFDQHFSSRFLESFYEKQADCSELNISKLKLGVTSPNFEHPYELTHFTFFLTKAIQLCPDVVIDTFYWSEETLNLDKDVIVALTKNCKNLIIHTSIVGKKECILLENPSTVILPSSVTIEEGFTKYKNAADQTYLPDLVKLLFTTSNIQLFKIKDISVREPPSVLVDTCEIIAGRAFNLSELALCQCNLTDLELLPLINRLVKMKYVDLQQNKLSQKSLYQIFKVIISSTFSLSIGELKLVKLNFSCNLFQLSEDSETVQLKKHLIAALNQTCDFITSVNLEACGIPKSLLSSYEFCDILAKHTLECSLSFNALPKKEAGEKFEVAKVRRYGLKCTERMDQELNFTQRMERIKEQVRSKQVQMKQWQLDES